MKIHNLGGDKLNKSKLNKPNTISLGSPFATNTNRTHLSFSELRKLKQSPMSKGTEIHKVLEAIMLGKTYPSEYYDSCLKFLQSSDSPIHNLKEPFQLKPEFFGIIDIESKSGKIPFHFIIDLLIYEPDCTRIIDYKTCNHIPVEPSEINLQQILTYAYCMFIMYNILYIQVELIYLKVSKDLYMSKTFTYKLTEKDLIEQGEILKNSIDVYFDGG